MLTAAVDLDHSSQAGDLGHNLAWESISRDLGSSMLPRQASTGKHLAPDPWHCVCLIMLMLTKAGEKRAEIFAS